MTSQLLSLGLLVLCSLAFVALERMLPFDRGFRVFRKGFATDLLAYGILQSLALGALIAAIVHGVDALTGWSRHGLLSGWPVLAQLGFFLVTHDLYIYWFHRLQHSSAWLWRTHEAHHSVEHVDWLAGVRSHPLEILINQTIEFAPIALLGAAPEVAILKSLVDAVWGMFIHSNLDVSLGPLRKLINGPRMHRWHHAPELGAPGKNFGTKLALWDFAFGTAYETDRRPLGYGLCEGQSEFPTGYVGQTLWLFRGLLGPRRERAQGAPAGE